MLPVVIGSNPERIGWLADCLETIPYDRPLMVHRSGGYEIAALRAACQHYDRFLFIHDSTVILDEAFWGIVDTTGPAWLFGGPPMYMAVYDRDDLLPALDDAPQLMDKASSIVWEGELAKRLQYPTLWPEVTDATGRIEHHHGRRNLVLENSYLRKWKGTWT